MDKKSLVNFALVALCGLLLGVAGTLVFDKVFRSDSVQEKVLGAGTQKAEDYIPYILYNDGYYSEKSITTTASVALTGTSTQFSVAGTTTQAVVGVAAYNTRGGIDFADVQIQAAATGSVLAFIPNPFGNATTGILSLIAQITGPATGAISYDISTSTSGISTSASSSPALIRARAPGANNQDTVFWTPGTATSTAAWDSVATEKRFVLLNGSIDGSSPFFLRPITEGITWRIATSSPGTTGNRIVTGTLSASFMKP